MENSYISDMYAAEVTDGDHEQIYYSTATSMEGTWIAGGLITGYAQNSKG